MLKPTPEPQMQGMATPAVQSLMVQAETNAARSLRPGIHAATYRLDPLWNPCTPL